MPADQNDPVRKYLDELRKELEIHRVAPQAALSDASEFLENERQLLVEQDAPLSAASLYAHFLRLYGTPRDVARDYAETGVSQPGEEAAAHAASDPRSAPKKRVAVLGVLSLATCVGLCVANFNQEPPTLSPFTEVRYEADRVVVQVRGKLYEFVALDDLPSAKILQAAKDHFGDRWQKRFAEDLVEVLWRMGHQPGAVVKLELRDLETGEKYIVADAAMTEANRQAVWRARNRDGDDFRFGQLSGDDAATLIRDFSSILRERWSYYSFSSAEIDGAIASLANHAAELTSMNALALELQKIIALGIDGHAEVSGWSFEGAYLPFLIEPSADRHVAFLADRTGFVDDEYPFIESIDERPIAEWCKLASSIVPKGSGAYVQRQALRQLRHIPHWRHEMGLSNDAALAIELRSQDGKGSKILKLPLGDRLPTYGVWPKKPSKVMDGNIGYLRLPMMDDEAVAEIKQRMAQFRDTDGLIVDVRDNGGGSREPLLWLHSYLTDSDAPPRVVNCAKYRLFAGFPDDQLASRFMYRADSRQWSAPERTAIATFCASFRPQWKPPQNQFSDWHYLVLRRLDDLAVYHYFRPVVVLMNGKCFSATDIFLASLKGLPNVKLVGTPSAGGSARVETARIANSPIHVRLGSMVSFMRSGELFDGNGVTPDVIVDPAPEYFIGRRDNVLDEALTMVRGM